jgi:hypothetical protein
VNTPKRGGARRRSVRPAVQGRPGPSMTGRISRQLTDRITLSDRDVPGERRAQTWMIGATEQAHYAAGCWIWPAYHHEMSCLQLGPFERQHLPLVEPWFTDADTRRWLGGPAWPRQTLDLADRPLGEFAGQPRPGGTGGSPGIRARRSATSTAALTTAGQPGRAARAAAASSMPSPSLPQASATSWIRRCGGVATAPPWWGR